MSAERLFGLPVSQGIATGTVFVYNKTEPAPPADTVSGSVEDERRRRTQAEHMARDELERRIARFDVGETEKKELFRAHLEILDDPFMAESIEQRLQSGKSYECAVWDTYQEMLDAFEGLDDPMFRERAADLRDVRNRLLRCSEGQSEQDLSFLDSPVILVARDLTPSDTACLPKEHVLAIAAELGSGTSHTAILARSCGIPAVLGIDGLLSSANSGQTAIVDAMKGEIIFDPAPEVLEAYQAQREDWLRARAGDEAYLTRRAVTTDGTEIFTEINLGSVADAHSAAAAHADGVGLLRTEFLYMQADALPDEESQYQAYSEILQAFGDRPVILRTLDIGGDKSLSYLELPKEENPFLGLRALRFCFEQEDLFRTQLRAAYRASIHGQLWIMFPMVASMSEFRKAKAICEDVQRELAAEAIPFRKNVRLGIMIEIPSIALAADLAARETDFASIGTNDLCQYTCAADRMNATVAPYYQSDNPGFLRLIAYVAKAYAEAGKPLGVCGEMASDPQMAPVLAGLGVRYLSMSGSALGKIRRILSEKSMNEMQSEAQALLNG